MAEGQGWDRAEYTCHVCGRVGHAETEEEYVRMVAAHKQAHRVWDRLSPEARRTLAELAENVVRSAFEGVKR